MARCLNDLARIMWKHLCWMSLALLLIVVQAGAQAPEENNCNIQGISIEALPLKEGSICVINTNNAGAQWFFISSTGNQHIGPVSPGFKTINTIEASEDGRYLAVYSVAEGHTLIELIDLQQLVQSKIYKIVQRIDPYPGHVELDGWKGGQLYVKSDMLLTHPDKETGRYTADMVLSWMETFAMDPVTGRLSGVSDGAKNPAEHYAKVLLDQSATESEKDKALVKLLSTHSGQLGLPMLIKILEQEQDPKRMNKLLDEINALREKE